MTPADIAAVAELEAESFADPWPLAFFFEELSLPGREYVVVEDSGRIVGYGGIMLIDRDAHVMTIAVRPERRRQGLGTRVMVALFDAALERGPATSPSRCEPPTTGCHAVRAVRVRRRRPPGPLLPGR
jgi:ribosomal protein S18 acetylase RimI-like enzyme